MKLALLRVTVACLIVPCVQLKGNAGSFVYEAVPFTLTDSGTGDEYSISGTFTTDCNDCLPNFLAWEIEALGSVPFTFTENNSNVSVQAMSVVATPKELVIVDDDGAIVFNANGPSMLWQRSPTGGVDSHDVLYFNDPVFALSTVPSTKDFVIATFVPEPTSVVTALLGLLGILALSRRG